MASAGGLGTQVLDLSNDSSDGRLCIIETIDLPRTDINVVSRTFHFRFTLDDFVGEVLLFLLGPAVFSRGMLGGKFVCFEGIVTDWTRSSASWFLGVIKDFRDVSLLFLLTQCHIYLMVLCLQIGEVIRHFVTLAGSIILRLALTVQHVGNAYFTINIFLLSCTIIILQDPIVDQASS